MCAALRNLTIFQDNNQIAVKDGSKPMGNKDRSSAFLFDDAVDVPKECLLGMGIKGRCLLGQNRSSKKLYVPLRQRIAMEDP
jgi:hypothetical protein